MIDKNKWDLAQRKERGCHEGGVNYEEYYKHCVSLLGTSFDLGGKSALEIGPAKVPFLKFCKNYKDSYIIEPLRFEENHQFCQANGIKEINDSAENIDFPQVDLIILINLLQHVLDPSLIIEKSKKAAKEIWFFEPIQTAVDDLHLWSFDAKFFEDNFGVAHLYPGGSIKGFHGANCVYGVWNAN